MYHKLQPTPIIKLKQRIHKQEGVTLVELLVVVAIIAILGAVSGLFLIKYLPEYYLRSAASTLYQDLRQAQVNAIKNLRPWSVTMNATSHSYHIQDASGNVFKTTNLSSYGGDIRFTSVTGSPIQFDVEGFASNGNATMRNSRGSQITIQILRTGALRVQ